MNVTMSSSGSPELTVNRTNFPADDGFAVQVFLIDSGSSLYLSVAEARILGERLMAAADAEVTA